MWPRRRTLPYTITVIVLFIQFYVFGNYIINDADKYFANTFDCNGETMLSMERASQDDKRLIYAIKKCYIEPPSRLPYNLKQPNRRSYGQAGQDEFLDNVFNHKVSFILSYIRQNENEAVMFSITVCILHHIEFDSLSNLTSTNIRIFNAIGHSIDSLYPIK